MPRIPGGVVLQWESAAQVEDASTASQAFSTLLQAELTSGPGSTGLLILASLSGSAPLGVAATMRVLVDGAPVGGCGMTLPISGAAHGAVIRRVTVAPGVHTVELQWRLLGAGTFRVRPTGQPDTEHAQLVVVELAE